MAVIKKVARKVRKKQWFKIIAPKLFHDQDIGEIYLYDIANAIGRSVNVNLTNLTRDIKRSNINLKFKINRISGDKVFTDVVGYEMVPASIKRMVRRGKGKIDMSFVVETTDGKKVRVKPLLITQNLVKHSVSLKLRKTVEDVVAKNFKKSSYANIIQMIVIHKFQSNLKKQLHKIYPLRIFEIRSMHIEKESKAKGLSEEIIKKEIEAKAMKEKDKEKEEQKVEEKKKKPKLEAKKEERKEEKPKKSQKKEEKVEEKPEEKKEEETK